MKLQIVRQTVANRAIARPGDVVDVDEKEARVLKAANKAIDFADAEVGQPARQTRPPRTSTRKGTL